MRLETAFGPVDATEHGDGGDLAVLLHAAGSTPRALTPLARQLEPLGFRSLLPALPMQPLPASGPSGPAALQLHVDAGRATLATGHARRRILVGHSFGGLVALLAALDGSEPDAVILYEPIVLDLLSADDPDDARARAWDRALIDQLAAGVAAGTPEAGVAAFIEAYNEVRWITLPVKAREAIVAGAAAMRDLTHVVHHLPLDRDALRRLDCVVLILHGGRSPEAVQRMAARLAEVLPRATLVQIKTAGHMAPVLAPEVVIAEIATFLTQA